MAQKVIYLAELQPYNPVAGYTVSINFSDNLTDAAELGTERPYHVRMRLGFSSEIGAFDDNVPGGTSFALGTIDLANHDGVYDYLMYYNWDTRPVVIKRGFEGDPYSAYETVFSGASLEMMNNGDVLTIVLRDTTYKLIEPIQKNKYAGTGNAEGGLDLANRRKPLCYGKVRNLTPVWVDVALLIMQIHDGPIEAVTDVYDKGNKLTFSANFTTYSALASATIAPGYYATCRAQGFIRLGAKAAGVITVDADGQYTTATLNNLPLLVSTVLQSKAGIPVANISTASVTALALDFPYAYEGLYFSEPDATISEFVENLIASMNAFWYVANDGKITFKQFKFRAPVATVEEQDIANIARDTSPAPLYRVVTSYARNATVQTQDDFAVPRETLNGWLKNDKIFVPTNSDGTGGTWSYVGEMEVYLNDTKINGLAGVQFREVTDVPWLIMATDGTFTINNPGAQEATVTLEARLGEFTVTEDFTVTKRKNPLTSTLLLAVTRRRFIFDDNGAQNPASQTSVITASGTGLGTTTWSAVDNLGNSVAMTGSGTSRTISANTLSNSALIQWIRVTVTDTTNNISTTTKLVVQRGTDAYAAAVLAALAGSNEDIDIYYQNGPTGPTNAQVDDLWFDLADSNKLYRWTGSAWVEVSDSRIADALTAAAGAQATADGKIRTYFTETTPVNNPPTTILALGDLWYKPSTRTLYRWNGTNWSSEVGTWGATWGVDITGIPTNLAVLIGTENINNQLILNSIASDQILSVQEKMGALAKLAYDLEARYLWLRPRAVAVGVSVAELDDRRALWRALLVQFAYNITSSDTNLLSRLAFSNAAFPSGWTANNGVTSTFIDPYNTVTDNNDTQYGYYSRAITRTAGVEQTYTACMVVKKDTVSNRTAMIRLWFTSGAPGTYKDVVVRTDTGAFQTSFSGTMSGQEQGVVDLGDDWLVYVTGTTNSAHTSIQTHIYPALANNLFDYDPTIEGSVQLRESGMILVRGNWTRLGRWALEGVQVVYADAIAEVAKLISEVDGSTTDWVDGPTTANIDYNNAGTVIEGPVDLLYKMKVGTGTTMTSGVTGAYRILDGNVNGFNSTSGDKVLTAVSGAFTFTVASMTTATATVQIRLTRNGLTKTQTLVLTRVLAPVADTSGGGGGGSGTVSNQTSGFTGLTTTGSTYSQISATLATGVVPSGKTTATVKVQLTPRSTADQTKIAGNYGAWNVKYKLRRNSSGTRTDVGSPATADSAPDPYNEEDPESGFIMKVGGTMTQNFTYTVSAGTNYSLEIWAVISSGSWNSSYAMGFTGSISVVLS